MSGLITHLLLDQYESVSGELEKLQTEDPPDAALRDQLDELMLDLPMINNGYAKEGYIENFARQSWGECARESEGGRTKSEE